MATITNLLRRVTYSILPKGTQALWIRVNELLGRPPRQFEGWGMTTTTLNPWASPDADAENRVFFAAHEALVAQVKKGSFRLSHAEPVHDEAALLARLLYRHYYIWWSVRYAAAATASVQKTLAECGVCDGLSAYFAMSALQGTPCQVFLYDAFAAMRTEDLLPSEQFHAGEYGYLSMKTTVKNLAAFSGDIRWCQGIIPESFTRHELPRSVAWLHIDLNASVPTTAALERFWEIIEPGGIILFDDYAWPGWIDTKRAVDRFFIGKHGTLLQLPTGQAMYFKLSEQTGGLPS